MSLANEYIAIGGLVVEAEETTAKITGLEGLLGTLESEDSKDYARRYHKWAKGGRKGKAPKAKGGSPLEWKYIRRVVSGI